MRSSGFLSLPESVPASLRVGRRRKFFLRPFPAPSFL
nr:MAG TPA: hypothetical protein [Caudoviricetes sp.]